MQLLTPKFGKRVSFLFLYSTCEIFQLEGSNISSKTIWQMVLEAAQELSQTQQTFTRVDIVKKIHEINPEVLERSIRAHIQAMSQPDFRHPYLERIDYGQYRLRTETIDIDPNEEEESIEILKETRLSIEHDLESFIIEQIDVVEEGLKLKESGYQQVTVESGRLDVLAEDSEGHPVVIELKAGQAKDQVLTQILAYIGDIMETSGDLSTRGIIIAHGFSGRLIQAVKIVPNVILLRYSIKFTFTEP